MNITPIESSESRSVISQVQVHSIFVDRWEGARLMNRNQNPHCQCKLGKGNNTVSRRQRVKSLGYPEC